MGLDRWRAYKTAINNTIFCFSRHQIFQYRPHLSSRGLREQPLKCPPTFVPQTIKKKKIKETENRRTDLKASDAFIVMVTLLLLFCRGRACQDAVSSWDGIKDQKQPPPPAHKPLECSAVGEEAGDRFKAARSRADPFQRRADGKEGALLLAAGLLFHHDSK